MRIILKKKPRKFKVGKEIVLKDCGKIILNDNEQISFLTKNLSRYEVTKKKWGFYATQSVNHRLKKKFKTAIVINSTKKIYIMLVEKKYIKQFKKYCDKENQKVLLWLDKI